MTFLLAEAGPGITVHGWQAWTTLAGTTVAAVMSILYLFRKVVFPMTDGLRTLGDIADKFGEAGHETISMELRALAANDEVAAANQRAMMAQLETVIAQQKASDAKLSETRHKIIGEFATLGASAAGARTLVEAIVKTSEDLQLVRRELAQLERPPER
jgi:hypothetical protein